MKSKYTTAIKVIIFFSLVAIVSMIGFKCSAQSTEPKLSGFTTYGAAGITNGFFSADVHAGARINKLVLTAGYLAMPNNTQPVLFQIRAGITISNRWHVYAGAARVSYSSDDKTSNYNTYSVGVQYHTLHYDRGSIFYHANYSPGFISAGVGMSFNLVNKD
jgi:hypothetical protein